MRATAEGVALPWLARAVEERGFESLVLPEHTHVPVARRSRHPGGEDLMEAAPRGFAPFVALAFVAAATERRRIGTGVSLIPQHDPIVLAKAKQLILSGGYKVGDNFDDVYPTGEETERVTAQLCQANVPQRGFKLDVQEIDRAAHGDYRNGPAPAEQKPMIIGAQRWWPDSNDPWNQVAPNFRSRSKGGTSNAGYWTNNRFDAIMAEAEGDTDENRLAVLMKEAQNILTEQDPPVISYGQLQSSTVLQKAVQGFTPNPLYLGSYPFYRMSRASG